MGKPWISSCNDFLLLPGLGHFKDEASFKLIEGELKDVQIKQVASSADCCLALSGNKIHVP